MSEIAVGLGQKPIAVSEPIPTTLARLRDFVQTTEAELGERQKTRTRILANCRRLVELDEQSRQEGELLAADSERLQALDRRVAAADARKQTAREIVYAAEEARSAVVTRVFNGTLNTIWRDLFVRLAPEEPFVPAFALPGASKTDVLASLETVHRSGGRAGSPGAMLSAGNLNTAALTLFLALNLAVEAKWPVLLLDDPVQSMDDVHIAQFAALLRRLSKEHGRQILLAVHERQLFEYLQLELSPSFVGDQLITVELGRAADGGSLADSNVRTFEPDAVNFQVA